MPITNLLITTMCSRSIACTTPGSNLLRDFFPSSINAIDTISGNFSKVQAGFSVFINDYKLWKDWNLTWFSCCWCYHFIPCANDTIRINKSHKEKWWLSYL